MTDSGEYNLDELSSLTKLLWKKYSHLKVWVLEGMLGTGKTTFVQHLGAEIGISDDVISPTFSLVNEYRTSTGEKVYHLDLYRLKNISEAMEIGLSEMEESGYFCLVEWGSAIGYTPCVPWLEIRLEHMEQTRRKIRICAHED